MPKRCRCCLFTGIRLDRYINHHNHRFHLCFESSRTHVITQIIISIIGFRHYQSTYLMCFCCHDFDHTLFGSSLGPRSCLGRKSKPGRRNVFTLVSPLWTQWGMLVSPLSGWAYCRYPSPNNPFLPYCRLWTVFRNQGGASHFLAFWSIHILIQKHSLLAGQTIRNMTSSRCKWEIVIRTLQSCQHYANSGR